jgi:integral membrane protein (TIGR00529 family)
MVDKASDGIGVSQEQKAFSNFWFRHIMEFVAPVYTAIIMLSQLSGLPISLILRTLLPIALITMLSAVPVAFYRTKRTPVKASDMIGSRRNAFRDLLISFSPLVAVLVMVIVFGLSPIAAIIPVILVLGAIFRPPFKVMKKMLIKMLNANIILMVLGIMFYKEVLTATGGISALAKAFSDMGLPKLAMIMLLPFAGGVLTGLSSPTIALTLPILISMYGTSAITPQVAALAYTGCNIGMNLTPTHLCLVLTADYFKVDMLKLIGMMLIPAAITLTAAALILY